MNMPAYRGIFVTDLDGTLLRGGRISPEDLAAFGGLGDLGVLRVIATGRSLHSAEACLPADFPADYVILSTGSQVMRWKTREVLRCSSLSNEAVGEVCAVLGEFGLSFMVHDDFPNNRAFAFRRGAKTVEDFERRLTLYAGHGREMNGCAGTKPASQVLAIVDARDASLYETVAGRLEGLSVIRATSPLDDASVWIEIFAAGVSKASGLADIIGHHGLHGLPVAAIGNDHNDRDMLDMAHIPFKVGNSHLDGEDSYLTVPDTQDAVALAIAQYTQMLQAGATGT
jgi:hydroxymethylpyrimidine pyrophosphatase-like HAD family hydrolase